MPGVSRMTTGVGCLKLTSGALYARQTPKEPNLCLLFPPCKGMATWPAPVRNPQHAAPTGSRSFRLQSVTASVAAHRGTSRASATASPPTPTQKRICAPSPSTSAPGARRRQQSWSRSTRTSRALTRAARGLPSRTRRLPARCSLRCTRTPRTPPLTRRFTKLWQNDGIWVLSMANEVESMTGDMCKDWDTTTTGTPPAEWNCPDY
jgi:hypothetical protein